MAFSMGGGMGIAGEAGPEMIAPIRRDSNGNMGVSAGPTNITINNNTSAQVTSEESEGPGGSKQLTFFIENTVRAGMSAGRFDKDMAQFGARRRPM